MNRSVDDAKRRLGEFAAGQVEDGMRIGIGSGSTVAAFIEALGIAVQQRLSHVTAAAASERSASRVQELGIAVEPLEQFEQLDLAVDGADAVGPLGTLIKGGGAALVRERLILQSARRRLILVDFTKPLGDLSRTPVPVAVVPYGWAMARRHLKADAADVQLRQVGSVPVVTDDGLYILDVTGADLTYPAAVHERWKLVPAVADTGIFAGLGPEVWVSEGDAVWRF